jgi:hypothetical protein
VRRLAASMAWSTAARAARRIVPVSVLIPAE